jgi:hypothetical protein
MHNRLITFGCSYTFGTGLPDCIETSIPSNLGWPAILGKLMDRTVVNVSAGGASNFEILYNILNFKFDEQDTVVIMWTHYSRDTFFRKLFSKRWPIDRISGWSAGNNFIRIVTDPNVMIGNKWIENMNDKTFIIKSWAYMHHADLYLKSKNIKYLHTPVDYDELSRYKQTFTVNNLYTAGMPSLDKCLDGHPGIESNKQTAETFYKILHDQ